MEKNPYLSTNCQRPFPEDMNWRDIYHVTLKIRDITPVNAGEVSLKIESWIDTSEHIPVRNFVPDVIKYSGKCSLNKHFVLNCKIKKYK